MSRIKPGGLVCLLLLITIAIWSATGTETPQTRASARIIGTLNQFPAKSSDFASDREVAVQIIRAICNGDLQGLQSMVDHADPRAFKRSVRLARYALQHSKVGFEVLDYWNPQGPTVAGLILYPLPYKNNDLMLTVKDCEPPAVHVATTIVSEGNKGVTSTWTPSKEQTAQALLASIGKNIVETVNRR